MRPNNYYSSLTTISNLQPLLSFFIKLAYIGQSCLSTSGNIPKNNFCEPVQCIGHI